MLAQRLRRWPNIKTSSFQRVVFAGIYMQSIYLSSLLLREYIGVVTTD